MPHVHRGMLAGADASEQVLPSLIAEFVLVNAGGTPILIDGCPDDIEIFHGVRLVVLHTPSERHSWGAGRIFPRVPGDLVLEAVLSQDDS